ncbi:Uncharacterised protein [Weeksella virosa]|uniref:Uncharacterized protein n=1 Tax=Weeksella virosa (strain ATCC 43766 / DSM 16922 / JCM 21250 / CCUG 30538 / CDC 9751 / IAM 14551 / NBRC 16016 / NCTC 11634 / CL345/78) TaxID=865938 RepID=F0NXA4_WEEVC|nr:hypothetical protein Weevi_0154 [Weeksella virosa DSM 16922]QCX54378.1 hypothetical protein FGE20_11820 [Elizabethkingia sp. JS20170427COW]VEH63395.1 Uncharacterised protein [Weeksella virosa]
MKNAIRTTSIISYLLIILAGQMIGLPFICWLFFTLFDFGNIDQLFAILGIIGIILNLTKWKNETSITIISFVLMLSPIASRLVQVPLEKFNYLAFQIPLTIFIITYLTFIIINIRQKLLVTRYCQKRG